MLSAVFKFFRTIGSKSANLYHQFVPSQQNTTMKSTVSMNSIELKNLEYEAILNELEEWFHDNPKLPKLIDRLVLKRFYHSVFEDVEETKKLIVLHYEMRNKNPKVFLDRDPADNDCCNTFKCIDMILLPGMTPSKDKISIYRFADPDALSPISDTKTFLMFQDFRLVLHDNENARSGQDILAEGEIQIFDMKGITLRHITKFSYSTLRIYLKFLQDAFPVRLRGVHIINSPGSFDKILTILRPFLAKETLNLLKIHPDLASLHEVVPREMLPEEYDGMAGNMFDLKNSLREEMLAKRDYLRDPQYWKIEGYRESKWW